MKGLKALIAPKNKFLGFNPKNVYTAYYILEPIEDQGWFTKDSNEAEHWLSPKDGKSHQDIHQEEWIVKHFEIMQVT
jgi:hypothetical protein